MGEIVSDADYAANPPSFETESAHAKWINDIWKGADNAKPSGNTDRTNVETPWGDLKWLVMPYSSNSPEPVTKADRENADADSQENFRKNWRKMSELKKTERFHKMKMKALELCFGTKVF